MRLSPSARTAIRSSCFSDRQISKLTLNRIAQSFFDRAMPMNYFVAEAIWLWSSAAADVLISIALSISLHKRIRGFNATLDGVLKHLILVGLRTAAYSAAASIVGAALSTAFANSSDYHVTTIGFAWWGKLARNRRLGGFPC